MSYGKRLNKNLDWRKECMQKREKERKVSNIVWRVRTPSATWRLGQSGSCTEPSATSSSANLSPDAQTDDCNDDCGVWASCGGSHRDETVGCTAGFDDADVASGNCDVADFADGNCGAGAGKADCDDTGVAEVDVMAGVGDSHRRGRRCSHTDLSTISTNLAGRRPDDARVGLNLTVWSGHSSRRVLFDAAGAWRTHSPPLRAQGETPGPRWWLS